jgi:hypothetical protein
MAVIFFDGFDGYTTADIPKRWTMAGTQAVVGSVYARSPSGQGLFQGGSSTLVAKSFGTNYTQGIVGFAWSKTATTSATIFAILDGITEQISVRTNASGVLTVTRNATVLATGTTVLSANTWYYIELSFTISNAAGVVELKLNGVAEIASTTALDTTNTANVYWNGVSIPANVSAQYDDVYVLDPTTGSNTAFLGPVRCALELPAGPGTTTAWSPNGGTNYGCVSEPYEDGDGSFNQSSTANQIDTFAMQDPPASAGTVFAVQTLITARQDAGAARTIAPVLRPSATDRVGATVSLSTTYQILTQIHDVSPETSAAWTLAEVASTEVGYKLIS